MAIEKILNGISGEEAAQTIYDNDLENANAIEALAATVPPTVQGKNLFNPANIVDGQYLQSQPPYGLTNAAGWAHSGFIPVTAGDYYLSSDKERIGLALYDAAKQNPRYLTINTGKFTVQAGEAFVLFNLKSTSQPTFTWAQLERGSVATPYEPFGRYVAKNAVEGLPQLEAEQAEQAERLAELDPIQTEISTTDNVLDPASVTDKAFISFNNGALLTGTPTTDTYFTTPFMPVTAGQLITGVRRDGLTSVVFRATAFYNSAKVYISGRNTSENNFTVPAGAAFYRTSLPNELHPATPASPRDFAIFVGPAQPFEDFGTVALVTIEGVQPEDKPDNAVATMADVRAAESSTTVGKLKYSQSLSVLDITAGDNRISFLTGSARVFSGNNMTNFNNYNIFGVSAAIGDDAAPVHIEGHTMGANHGRVHNIANIPAHGLDNAAIGTEWLHTNGLKYYPIRIVDANNVAFLSENTGTFESPVFTAIPVGSITRGATTLTVSNITPTQLYPSIKNLSLKVYDHTGKEILKQTSGSTDFVRIVESYEIMYSPDILANLIARAGQTGPPVFDGRATCRVTNTYHITDNLTVVVSQIFERLMAVAFADTMVTQAVPLGNSVPNTAYYVPHSNPLNGSVDLRKPVVIPWASNIPSTFVVNANQPDPTNPPNRVAMYNGNAGFLIGHLTDRGTGQNLAEFTDRTFELRNNTGKIYPHPVEGTAQGSPLPVGAAYSCVLYRTWTDLSATRTAERISYFNFDYDGAVYVFADYSASVVDRIDLGRPELMGKRIEVLEQVNAEVKTTAYGPAVISANYVEGETCFAVFKIY